MAAASISRGPRHIEGMAELETERAFIYASVAL
jgi:hypothetical protein